MNAIFPTPDTADSQRLLSPEELEAALRDIGARRYHNLHPFHRLLHDGKLSKDQVRAWALNRYYYQAMIPVKDAAVLARMTDASLRRIWRQRIVDQDAVAIDLLAVADHARNGAEPAGDPHRAGIGKARKPAGEHAGIELIGLAIDVDIGAGKVDPHGRKAAIAEMADQLVHEGIF